MAQQQRYRKLPSDDLNETDDEKSSVPPIRPRVPPPPPPPVPRIPPPPPIPARRFSHSKSPSYQQLDESVTKQTAEMHLSTEEKPTGARPKERPTPRSFSFVEHVQKNRVERDDSSSAPPQRTTSPSMSSVYRSVPERSKVSFNPAGRDSPSAKSPSHDATSAEDLPKKGFMRNLFSKARDFMTRKNYAPLDQDPVELSKKKDKSKKYTHLGEETTSSEKPVKTRSFLKRLQSGSFSKMPEVESDPESENEETEEKEEPEASGEDLMDFRYAPAAQKSETFPVVASASMSDRESDFASSGEFEKSTESDVSQPPFIVTKSSTGTSETTAFALRPDLCRIKVNAPADIRVAYSYSGEFTTCISYDGSTSPKGSDSSTETQPDKKSS